MNKSKNIKVQATAPEKSYTVPVEIIPEEPHEPEEVWLEFFYQCKRPLGNGAWHVSNRPEV